jgi:phosphotransferase system enzyme I (PtsI)
MCGEMAADPFAVPLLIGLGLETLSASASAIPQLKKVIRSIKYKDVQALADACLILRTEKEINKKIHEFFNKNVHDQIKKLF